MGSPTSVEVGDVFMEEVEQRALESSAHSVTVWKRYVDDTFVVTGKDHIESHHQCRKHYNQQAVGIHFMVDREHN